MQTVTTAQMKAIDEHAIRDLGIPSLELMEHAAGAVASAALEEMALFPRPRVLVVCGTGNNGGDGLACARILMGSGAVVTTLLVGNPDRRTPDALANSRRLLEAGGTIQPYCGQPLPQADCIVDALFGFGLNREVGGDYRLAIDAINAAVCPVIACDIPSGLNGDTGLPMGAAVRAKHTVSFTCAKVGLVQEQAKEYVGKLSVVDIGIPIPQA